MEKYSNDIVTDHIGIAYMNRAKHLRELKKAQKKIINAPPSASMKSPSAQKKKEIAEDDDSDDDEEREGNELCSIWGQLASLLLKPCKTKLIEMYYSSQKYMHCELAFFLQNGQENVLAFGAASDLGVFKKERTFSNPSYDWIFLKTTRAQALEIFFFCENAVGQSYDPVGVQWSKVWPSYPYQDSSGQKTWWCSSFVVEALQLMGLFNTVIPQTIDIDDIIAFLEEHPLRITHLMTPFRLNAAVQKFRQDALSDIKVSSNNKKKSKNNSNDDTSPKSSILFNTPKPKKSNKKK
jgi:hypothetical protein